MNKIRSRILLYISFLLFFTPISAWAQADSHRVAMADLMRSNGKIYVVVAVLVIIFIGIILFLISIERRLHRLEKKQSDKKPSYRKTLSEK